MLSQRSLNVVALHYHQNLSVVSRSFCGRKLRHMIWRSLQRLNCYGDWRNAAARAPISCSPFAAALMGGVLFVWSR